MMLRMSFSIRRIRSLVCLTSFLAFLRMFLRLFQASCIAFLSIFLVSCCLGCLFFQRFGFVVRDAELLYLGALSSVYRVCV